MNAIEKLSRTLIQQGAYLDQLDAHLTTIRDQLAIALKVPPLDRNGFQQKVIDLAARATELRIEIDLAKSAIEERRGAA